MAEFRRTFEELSAPVQGLSDEVLEGTFVNGLHPLIRAEILSKETIGLQNVMCTAQLIEDRIVARAYNEGTKIPSPNPTQSTLPSRNKAAQSPLTRTVTLASRNPMFSTASNLNRKDPAFKRLSEMVYNACKAKGLCFRCNERYTIGHRCKNHKLRVLLAHDDDPRNMEIDSEISVEQASVKKVREVVELSLNMVVGFSTPGTMKLHGEINQSGVVVLIDCGATHNFISQKLVEALQIPTAETSNYGVVMGIGVAVKGKGICKGVILKLPELTIVENFLPLELGGINVVLGMQWLYTLGFMEVN